MFRRVVGRGAMGPNAVVRSGIMAPAAEPVHSLWGQFNSFEPGAGWFF